MCQLASFGDHINLRKLLWGLDLSGDTGDYDGRTPLHLACKKGHLEVVKVLLKHKADINFQDKYGRCPLEEAIDYGHDDVKNITHRPQIAVTVNIVDHKMRPSIGDAFHVEVWRISFKAT